MQDWCCCHQATALWLGLEPVRAVTEAVLRQEAGQLLLWLSGSSSGVVEMAANFACSFTALCCLALWSFTRTSGGTLVTPPHSTIRPGFPVPVNTNNPEVRKAARFGVYRYNNSSNDLFLFKESQIKKAMVQEETAFSSQRAEVHASRGNQGSPQPGQLSLPEGKKPATDAEMIF
ncbi:uncharacterized protein LOC135291688 [Passer domesticus]|uniref:uncharacterized protein LOC135291688 n=2 Tax=Passer domesticus TaxID=48849 RepID=UPI0030FE0F4F